jgi:CubicO group peptidase (beta-lactamase class C family)
MKIDVVARFRRARVYTALVCCAALVSFALLNVAPLTPLLAQTDENGNDAATEEAANPAQPTLADRAALEAFIDGLMAAQMADYHIPGAAVAVVHEGEIALVKGYGYADLETLTPVDAESTLFRLASVTKLFTWTAVMQLVEAGELDLDADINTYLAETDVRVPATFPARVNMGHLMAHTPGFEDRNLGIFARHESAMVPLDELLLDLPARVRQPGELSAYSNYGSGLAGLVVAQVSGMRWEEYIESQILEPLGMNHTTVRQPVPPPLLDDLSKGYLHRGTHYQEEGFEFVPIAPAGGASATAADMARFMLAHLQLGSLDGARILEEATARQMQTQHFTHDPLLPGMAHGFMEYYLEDGRWLEHSGDTIWFHVGLYLAPEAETGLFIVYNSPGGGAAREPFFQAFHAHYFQNQDDILPTPPTTASQQLAIYTGDYRTTRMAETTPDKIGGLLATLQVGAEAEGYLTLAALGLAPTRWTEIGPGRFREVEPTGTLGQNELIFHLDPVTERPNRLYYSRFPFTAFERTLWFESTMFQATLFGLALLSALIGVIAWPIQIWSNRKRPGRKHRWAQWAYGVGALTGLLLVIYLIIFAITLSDTSIIAFGMPPLFQAAGVLPLIILPLTLAMLGLAAFLWTNDIGRMGGRIFYTLAALILAVHLWQLWYWNFLFAALIG